MRQKAGHVDHYDMMNNDRKVPYMYNLAYNWVNK